MAEVTRRKFKDSLALAQANETESGCWPWPRTAANGYATCVRVAGKTVTAHIAVWLMMRGPVPAGLSLDHTCHSSSLCPGGNGCPHRRCVRPDHLEPATDVEQQRRQLRYKRETCKNGHLRTDENTLWVIAPRTGTQYRQCRDCNREKYLRYKADGAPGIYVAGQGYIRRQS